MHTIIRAAIFIILLAGIISCIDNSNKIAVTNTTNNALISKQVMLPIEKLVNLDTTSEEFILVNIKSGERTSVQFIDKNRNGSKDHLLWVASIPAKTTINYQLVNDTLREENKVYSRFIPERIDDFAWENDKVAFRVFGPKAENLLKENKKEGKHEGVISSGIDCWLKRVNYSIIDSWYEKYTQETGTYHEDTGEGLDSYHVGASRGCGGIGIWDNSIRQIYSSNNFTHWEILENGPVRTKFSLEYAPWIKGNENIIERKEVSLVLGSYLSKVEVFFSNELTVDTISVGLTLHDNLGVTLMDVKKGWFSYWEPNRDSELGTGIVVDSDIILGYTVYESDHKDESHLLVHLKPVQGSIVYYTGFGWKKEGRFNSSNDWNNYLNEFSNRLKNDSILVEPIIE